MMLEIDASENFHIPDFKVFHLSLHEAAKFVAKIRFLEGSLETKHPITPKTEKGSRQTKRRRLTGAVTIPSREDQSNRQDALTTAQEEFDRINGHSNRIVEIREELTDQDNPLSIDEIQAMEQESNDIRQSLSVSVSTISHEVELSNEKPIKAPDLQLTF